MVLLVPIQVRVREGCTCAKDRAWVGCACTKDRAWVGCTCVREGPGVGGLRVRARRTGRGWGAREDTRPATQEAPAQDRFPHVPAATPEFVPAST